MPASEPVLPSDLTEDRLLGGRVCLRQPRTGYRAATDPILLAAAVTAAPGQRVLDVGCGAGAAMLALLTRTDVEVHGLEIQSGYAALARENAALNDRGVTVWTGDIMAPPPALSNMVFDWVITNPPYFPPGAIASPDPARDRARREAVCVTDWTVATLRRVRSGGRFAMIHLADRLPDILAGLTGAGDIAVLPLQARVGRVAGRVIVTARKGARGPFRLAPPLIIHEGAAHLRDGDDFTDAALAVLRDGAPLVF